MRTLPAWVEVDLDALAANIATVRRRIGPQVRVLLIVKADAYGHGAVEVTREAVHAGVHMLGVATVDEGRELRAAGIDAAILVLSPLLADEIPAILDLELRSTIPDLEFARALSEQATARSKRVPVHLEIDTGMGRSGLLPEPALATAIAAAALPGLLLEGVYTHFPVSDTDPQWTERQLQDFLSLVARLRQAGVHPPLVHASNTAAVLQIPSASLDMVRPGGMLYGDLPDPAVAAPPELRRVMSFRARLVQVRQIPAGWSVSYGRDFIAPRDTVVGVVPVGYGHGLSRAYSAGGTVLFRGRRAPILGRITMDMTMIDLSAFEAPRSGEEIVIFGRQGQEEISVDEIGVRTGVIGYEVLCGISKRVVRVYVRGGAVQSMRGLTGVRSIHATSEGRA